MKYKLANGVGILFGVALVLCMVFGIAMASNAVCKEPYVLEWEAVKLEEIDCVPDRVGPKPEIEVELEEVGVERI